MRVTHLKRGVLALAAGTSALAIAFSGVAPAEAATTTITWLTDSGPAPMRIAQSIVSAFEKANPGIKVVVHTRPGGSDADNLVKTKLSTGSIEDVFNYNSGALLSAINPAKTLVDLSKEPFQKNVYDSYKPAVTVGGKQYGAPFGTALGGGIYYNVDVLKKAGITATPKTWDEFIADAQKIKASGVDAICGSFGDTWTAQLFVLADFYNVNAADKSFVSDYTNNKAKYAYTPAALSSWKKMEQTYKLGLYNADASTAKYSDMGARMGSGKCGFYPMVSWFTHDVPAELRGNVGLFAVPGASSSNYGITTWMPNAVYIPKATKKLAAAKKFVAFIASKKGTDAYVAANTYDGPFVTKDQSAAPSDVPLATQQLATLLKGKSVAALEFLSPLKGPNLPNICAQVLTGQISAAQGAALYDQDNVAQAQQLGLKGW